MSELVQLEATHRRRYEIAKMAFIVVGTATSMVIVGILLAGMARLEAITLGTRTNSQILIDCTSPTGKCYQASEKRTGSAIGTINQVSIYAAYCSKIPSNTTVKEIETCINKELAK